MDLNKAICGMGELLRGTLGGTVALEFDLSPDARPVLADHCQVEMVVLSLAINARDAKQSGGGVRIDTRVGQGTCVKVYLTRAATEPVRALPSGPVLETAGPAGQARLLLVDDDADLLETTASALEDFGCDVTRAGSAGAALDIVERAPAFDLMASRRPGMPVVYITGYADTTAMGEIGHRPVVPKPCQPDQLAETLRRTLARSRPVIRPPLSAGLA
jgi:CheY-like chemotaxis protein